MSMRSGASVSQLLAVRRLPVAAWILRLLSKRFMTGFPGEVDASHKDVFQKGPQIVCVRLPDQCRRPIVLAHALGLLHIAAAGDLHLNRMNAMGGIAIMARGPAAAKP